MVDKIHVYSNKTLTAPIGKVTINEDFDQYKKDSTLFAARYDLPAGEQWGQDDFTVNVGKNQEELGQSSFKLQYKNNFVEASTELLDEFPTEAGSYDCIVAGQGEYCGAQTVALFIGEPNPAIVKTSTKYVKYSKLKRKTLTVSPISIKNKIGTVECKKLSGSSKLSVKKNGKVSVRKKTKKGTYTAWVKVKLSGNELYAPEILKVKVTVKVKS